MLYIYSSVDAVPRRMFHTDLFTVFTTKKFKYSFLCILIGGIVNECSTASLISNEEVEPSTKKKRLLRSDLGPKQQSRSPNVLPYICIIFRIKKNIKTTMVNVPTSAWFIVKWLLEGSHCKLSS